jgi:reverse gyrase
MVRVCRNCGGEFDAEYVGRGRPREYCYSCLPEGTRWIGKKAARKVAA